MEKCVRCGIDENRVKLLDGIFDGKMIKVCERCSIIDNVPIIKVPGAFQLKESEKDTKVYERMKVLAGIRDTKREKTFFMGDKLRELEKKPELELPEKTQLNLIDHFHWEIMKNRRRKGLTQEKLAKSLGESLTAIQMVEKAKLPSNADALIRKLEQFLKIMGYQYL